LVHRRLLVRFGRSGLRATGHPKASRPSLGNLAGALDVQEERCRGWRAMQMRRIAGVAPSMGPLASGMGPLSADPAYERSKIQVHCEGWRIPRQPTRGECNEQEICDEEILAFRLTISSRLFTGVKT
jgi:hypothetical protein